MAGKGSRARHTVNAQWEENYSRIDFSKKLAPDPIYRCTWCCKDSSTHPECEHCGNECTLTDRTKPHRPEWSRKNMQQVECKVCDRVVARSEQGQVGMCEP